MRKILINLNPELPLPKGQEHNPWLFKPSPHHSRIKIVSELVDEYLLSDNFRRLSLKTRKCYSSFLSKLGKIRIERYKSIYDMPAYKVSYSTVDYFAKVLGLSLKRGSTSTYFTVMSSVWNYAIRGGIVVFNPWLRPGLKRAKERDVTWTSEQINGAIDYAYKKGHKVLALYLLMAYETAQRPWQDLRNLRWSDVKQLEDGSTVIDFKISKTGVHLILPLSNRAIDALKGHPKVSEIIFANPEGKFYSESAITRQLEKVKKDLDLPEELTFRDIRRTAITELAIAGCSTLEIEAITGWRCPESVLRRYARVRLKTAQNALQKRENSKISGAA
jgi:integrase